LLVAAKERWRGGLLLCVCVETTESGGSWLWIPEPSGSILLLVGIAKESSASETRGCWGSSEACSSRSGWLWSTKAKWLIGSTASSKE
jgi:hypothetical protein